MQIDYLIVGQGLCGSWLSYYLLQAGASVLVIDNGNKTAATAAASGIINPITGKRLARQWLADQVLPFAEAAYTSLGKETGHILLQTLPIQTFFSTSEEATFFQQKAESIHQDVLHYGGLVTGEECFNHHYGTGNIYPALLVDLPVFLNAWRRRLDEKGALLESAFLWTDVYLQDGNVRYQGYKAKAVIDCSGAASAQSDYWKALPFALNKGEAIIASIPDLPRDAIYKYGTLSIVPWKKDQFWLGSTFDWDFQDVHPTQAFRQKTELTLKQWLKLPYALHEHVAAIRPATVTRDAFSGMHPLHPQVGILNGMGSKGCSLAPFLAKNLAHHLLQGAPLIAQVDVNRYARALGRLAT